MTPQTFWGRAEEERAVGKCLGWVMLRSHRPPHLPTPASFQSAHAPLELRVQPRVLLTCANPMSARTVGVSHHFYPHNLSFDFSNSIEELSTEMNPYKWCDWELEGKEGRI